MDKRVKTAGILGVIYSLLGPILAVMLGPGEGPVTALGRVLGAMAMLCAASIITFFHINSFLACSGKVCHGSASTLIFSLALNTLLWFIIGSMPVAVYLKIRKRHSKK